MNRVANQPGLPQGLEALMVDGPSTGMLLNPKDRSEQPVERGFGRSSSAFNLKASFRWKKSKPKDDEEKSVHSMQSCPSPQKRPGRKSRALFGNYSGNSLRSINSQRSAQTTPAPQANHFPALVEEDEKKKKSFPKSLSFRWKRKNKESRKQNQMVADFFDVQSFASIEPSISENPNLCDEVAPKRFRMFRGLSGRSVTSSRSMGGRRSGRDQSRSSSSVGGSLFDSSSSVSSWQTESTDGTPRFLIPDGPLGTSYQDDDEITLGSAFSNGSGSRSVRRSGRWDAGGTPRRGVDRTISENWTSASRGQSRSQGKSKKKKKGLIKNIFRYFRSKNKKRMAREQQQQTVVSPTEDMDISCSSFDFEVELSQMKARYNQELSSRGSISSRGSDAMPNTIDVQLHYEEFIGSSSRSLSEDAKEEIEVSQPAFNQIHTTGSTDNAPNDDDDEGTVVSLLTGLLQTWSTEREQVIQGGSTQNEAEEKEEEVVLPPSCSDQLKGCLKKTMTKSYLKTSFTVAFSVVQVREFERTVGDNPACTSGPPISLGWAFQDVSPDEHIVSHQNRPKRAKREFHLSAAKRTALLVQEWQVSEMDIRKARREATYIQYCREKSAFAGGRGAKEASFLRKAQQKQKQHQRLQLQHRQSQKEQESQDQSQQLKPPPGQNLAYLKEAPVSPTSASSSFQSYKPLTPTKVYQPPSSMTCHSLPAATLVSSTRLDC